MTIDSAMLEMSYAALGWGAVFGTMLGIIWRGTSFILR